MKTKILDVLVEYYDVDPTKISFSHFMAVETVYIDPAQAVENVSHMASKLGATKDQMHHILQVNPRAVCTSPQRFDEFVDFFKNEFGFSAAEILKMMIKTPYFISRRPDTFNEIIDFYKNVYKIDHETVKKMVARQPLAVMLSVKGLLGKEHFYAQNFDYSRENFIKLVTSYTELLFAHKDTLFDKASFICEVFDLSQDEFISMFKRVPSVVGFSKNALMEKCAALEDIGVGKAAIIKNPMFTSVNPKSVVVKFNILRQLGSSEEIYRSPNWFITSEAKLYARCEAFKGSGKGVPQVVRNEKDFQKRYHLKSEDLMAEYPFTPELREKFLRGEMTTFEEYNAMLAQKAEVRPGLEF